VQFEEEGEVKVFLTVGGEAGIGISANFNVGMEVTIKCTK